VEDNNIGHWEKEWICVSLWMVADLELFESGVHRSSIPLLWCIRFMFVGSNNERSLRSADTRDEPFSHILDTAARVKKGEDLLRWMMRDLLTQIAKRTEVGGIFERLLWILRNLSSLCNGFVI
jgi:hypothetical protein